MSTAYLNSFSGIVFAGKPRNSQSLAISAISDRASSGVYKDEGLPALEDFFTRALASPWRTEKRLIPDERPVIEQTLKELVDQAGCQLVLTTGGTGPALRDVTPEAMLAVADKEMPGFGEQMRRISLEFVPTAILSRQVAVIRGQTLIINLPGSPGGARENLAVLLPVLPHAIEKIRGEGGDCAPPG